LCLDLTQHAEAIAGISEVQEPVLKFLGSLVKGDPSVYQGCLGIVVILHRKKSFTERGLVGGRGHIFDMIDLVILGVNTTANGTTHAFFSADIEPYHCIKATLLQSPRRLLLTSWLHQKEGITEVLLSWDRIHFLRWNVAAQGSFKKFRLSKGGREIEENPSVLFNLVRFLDLSLQFVDLDLDLCGILLLLALANSGTWGPLSLLSGRICDLLKLLDQAGNLLSLFTFPLDLLSDLRPYLLLRLVGIGESKLGDV
jgi:hypothetical protein